ncbi:MAG TPA: hypothetical protein ENJ53_06395 [Phaeodactylibacter sp.]|nr:hypothetical protein [Phaeodactylibacter sp.]
MVGQQIIQDPLTESDLIGLQTLEKVWMRRDYLRAQLSQFSKKRRQEFLEKVDLETKWERYAFSRFRNLPAGEKIGMKQLVDEIEMTFDFTLNWWQKKRLYQVRQKIYHLRMKEKRLQKPANK